LLIITSTLLGDDSIRLYGIKAGCVRRRGHGFSNFEIFFFEPADYGLGPLPALLGYLVGNAHLPGVVDDRLAVDPCSDK
jgi:hypothetical protein